MQQQCDSLLKAPPGKPAFILIHNSAEEQLEAQIQRLIDRGFAPFPLRSNALLTAPSQQPGKGRPRVCSGTSLEKTRHTTARPPRHVPTPAVPPDSDDPFGWGGIDAALAPWYGQHIGPDHHRDIRDSNYGIRVAATAVVQDQPRADGIERIMSQLAALLREIQAASPGLAEQVCAEIARLRMFVDQQSSRFQSNCG